jgi:hypothetical protein
MLGTHTRRSGAHRIVSCCSVSLRRLSEVEMTNCGVTQQPVGHLPYFDHQNPKRHNLFRRLSLRQRNKDPMIRCSSCPSDDFKLNAARLYSMTS